MRVNGTLTFLHTDHLGSTALLTSQSQQVVARRWYYPYGDTRYAIGETPTDRLFTGQRWDGALALYDYRARFYDPLLGRFISADPLVPEPGNPQALNRYAYIYNNPLRYIDPSGYDPLGPDWEDAFRAAHGRDPTDADRQARLYSILFPGPVSGGRDWTEEDWVYFHQNRVDLFMKIAVGRESLSDFADEIQRLSGWYSPGEEEQFVWAIALLYAGVPYGTRRGGVIAQGFGGPRVQVPECAGVDDIRCGWLNHGMVGFSSKVARIREENTHHYAGQLLAGYYLPEWIANTGTWIRETVQGIQNRSGTDQLDVNMGEIATRHGRGIAEGRIAPWDLPGYIRRDLAAPSGAPGGCCRYR